MSVRYVFKDVTQVGILNTTKKGIHIICGEDLTRFFKSLSLISPSDFIVHPVDIEGDQFIELTKSMNSGRDVEDMVEKVLSDHEYVLSPRRF